MANDGVIFLTDQDPTNADSGGKIRDQLWLELLGKHCKSKIFTENFQRSPYQLKRIFSKIRSYPENGFLPEVVDQLSKKYQPGTSLILSRLTQGKYIKAAKSIGYRVILDEHNVESNLIDQMLPSWPLAPYRNYLNQRLTMIEKQYCKAADLVICTSEVDRKLLSKWIPQEKIMILPNLINLASYRPSRNREERQHIIFSGTLDYYPNKKGLEWFFEKSFPILERKYPEMAKKVLIAGRSPTPDLVKLVRDNGVRLVQNPSDMKSLLAHSRLMFVPLLHGGGTRIKILEALASDCTVVTTNKGVEGIPYPEGSVLVADTPSEFVEKIALAYSDQHQYAKTRDVAHRFINDFCNLEQYRKQLNREILGVRP